LYENRPHDAAALLSGGAGSRQPDAALTSHLELELLDTALGERIIREPRDPGLLELRAALAGLRGNALAEMADSSAALQILAKQPAEPVSARLRRLYRRRGDAFVILKRWPEAIVDYAQVITPETTDAVLLSNRARAHEALSQWNAAAADWSRAAGASAEGITWLTGFARRLDMAAQAPLADAARAQARAWLEEKLTKEPENPALAEELARVLLEHVDQNSGRWAFLKPVEAKSQLGATLSVLPDQSVLASGPNPLNDLYRVSTTLERPTVLAAIRVEALAHGSLPRNGPGRHTSGSFAQASWKVTAVRPGQNGPLTLEFEKALSDRQLSWPVSKQGEWNIGGQNIEGGVQRNHTAVWSIGTPVSLPAGTTLTFEMQFKSWENTSENIGRFRLSVSSDFAATDQEQKRFAATKVTDPWARLAAAYALCGRNDKASAYFSSALKWVDSYEARKPILEFATRFDDLLPALSKRRPDDLQLRLALARKLAEIGKEHAAQKRPAQAQAELEKSREHFGRLRATFSNLHWTVLTPAEMKTENGAKLELQNDGSVFVHQRESAKEDSYTLVFPSELTGIAGVRLEALADRRLPGGGPGWNPDGNFVLSELTLRAAPAGSPDNPRIIALRDASADFSQAGSKVQGAADGDAWSGWAVLPELDKDHTAVFATLERTGDRQASRLTVGLSQNVERLANLGRFRLSFTSDAATLAATRIRLDLKDSELVDLHTNLATAYAQQGRANEALASFTEALDLATDRAAKAKIIALAAPLDGVLEKLAGRAGNDALFQAELARHFAEAGNAPLARACRAKARTLFEQKLAKEPENSAHAAELADLLLPPIDAKPITIVPTSETEGVSWRFSTRQPPAGWVGESFDDSAWNKGPGAFGGNGSAPGLVLRSEWKSSDIWLRRKFDWKPGQAIQTLLARVIYDDGFELFINGQQVLSRSDFTASYDFYSVDAKALGLLKPGSNTMAVHCHSTVGAQYIDVGLHGLLANPLVTAQRLPAMKIADPWAKLAAAYQLAGDKPALLRLFDHHPAASSGIGDLYAAQDDWEHALGEYNNAITPLCRDSRIFAARALAHEKLEHWELAAADWTNADLHALDKRVRYGNPLLPALERRAWIHGRLRQFNKQVVDYSELLKPQRFGDNPWLLAARGDAYAQLRQWDQARADYDQANKVCHAVEREIFEHYRLRAFAYLLADLPDQMSRSQFMSAAAGFDGLLPAAHAFRGDWKSAAASYARQTEQEPASDSIAWMAAPTLWGYAGDARRHRESCQKMYERFRNSTSAVDTERFLKTMLAMENGPELPAQSVQKFYASFDSIEGQARACFLVTRAWLECRKGDHVEAHKRVDEALALERQFPQGTIKALALAVRSLIYAKQKNVAQARKSLDQVKLEMTQVLQMKWQADGLLDGSTLLNGTAFDHDKLNVEILRREAEQLIKSAP
jgi:tetratricopeptide (TPR) repeat protein